jgi:transposase
VDDGNGLAEATLGLSGFRVRDAAETDSEMDVEIETTADRAAGAGCGSWAQPHEQIPVELRDLPCFGRPARLVWNKRRWRCVDADCEAKAWTETSPHISARVLLT